MWPRASLGAAQPARGGREGPSLALLVLSLRSEALGEPRQAFSGGPGSSHDLVVISGKLRPLEPRGPGPSTGHLRIVGSVLCKQNSAWGLTRSPRGGEGERESHQALSASPGPQGCPAPRPSPPSVYVRSAVHPRAAGQGRSPPLPPPPRPHSKPTLGPTAQCCRDFGPWGVGWGLGERGRAETPGADAQGGRGSLRGKGKPGPGPQPRASVPLQGCGRRTPWAHRPEPQHGHSPLADGKLRLRGGGAYSQARGSAKIGIPGAAASWALESPPLSPL